MTKILIDPKFHLHPKHAVVYTKVVNALKRFPDIKQICLSSFYPKKGHKYEDPDTTALTSGMIIQFNVKIVPSYNTIYHELQHIVQEANPAQKKGKTRKQIEEEATIFGNARMLSSQVEDNRLMYVSTVPKSKVVKYARIAAKGLKAGNKNAVKEVKVKIEKDKKIAIKKNPSEKGEWTKHQLADKLVKTQWVKVGNKVYAKGHTKQNVENFLKKVPNKPDMDLIDLPNDKVWGYDPKYVRNPPKWLSSGSGKVAVGASKPKKVVKKSTTKKKSDW